MQKVVIEKSYEIFAADLHTQKVYRNGISGAFPKPQWCDKTSLYVARKVLKILDLHEVYELEPYNGPRLSELPNRPHEGWHTAVVISTCLHFIFPLQWAVCTLYRCCSEAE